MGSLSFTAIDVETANADTASICQIGLAVVHDGELKEVISEIINPEDYFDPAFIGKHGISEADVLDKPTFDEFFPSLTDTAGPSH